MNIRRNGKLIEVQIEIPVLGSYSATSPWYCPKSRRIVKRAEEWIRRSLRPAEGLPQYDGLTKYHTDYLFLLASGNPELQGLVRRYAYSLLAARERGIDYSKEVTSGSTAWGLGYDTLFLGEYYHRTGDKRVLPYLNYCAKKIWMHQYRPPGSDLTKYAVATEDAQTGGFYTNWKRFPGHGRTVWPDRGRACPRRSSSPPR